MQYLTQRQRQVVVINLFFEETLLRNKNQPQVGMYSLGHIPRAILKEKYVFLLSVRILPDLVKDNYQNFDVLNVDQSWYNDKV